MTRFRILILFLFVIFLSACDQDMVYDQYMTTENGQWGWHDTGLFEAEVNDTLSLHNVYLQVRHTTDYPMSNLYMFVVLKGPTGQFLRDTVNMTLAAPNGRWIGTGIGKFRELHLLYRKQIRFDEPGTYTIIMEQAMRKEKLPVTDVGVRIERVNPE